MDTSFIAHRSGDGSRLHAVLSLGVLRSLNHAQVSALQAIGIHTLSDLLHYVPVHRARLIVAVARNQVAHDMDLSTLVRDAALAQSPSLLAAASTEVIDGIGPSTAVMLQDQFGVRSVEDLASFPPFVEAETIMRSQAEAFSEPASAPDELIPRATGSVTSKMRLSSFVREATYDFGKAGIQLVNAEKAPGPDERLFSALVQTSPLFEISLGYILRHTQRWVNLGTYLGEVVHSLPLAPGESRNVVVLDWKRSLLAQRGEETTTAEVLNSLLVHTRALDEVTRAVAEEHQSGRTSSASATGVTAGGAVASASMIGAIGGAVVGGTTGALVGLSVDALTGGTDLGLGTISGTIVGSMAGSAVGSAAGAAAASLIFSGAGALGFIESDSQGDREIIASLHQNIMDLTSQKSSSIRSLRSTVVFESSQEEKGNVTTFNVTNYNHSHALTVQYYEILQRYLVQISVDAIEPILILPFNPLKFDKDLVVDYFDILRVGIQDKELVRQFDQLLTDRGILALPDEPISPGSDPLLTSITVLLRTKVGIDLGTTDVFLVDEANGDRKLDATGVTRIEDGGEFGFLDDIFVKEYRKTFSPGSKLSDITHIKVKLTGVQNVKMYVEVESASIQGDNNQTTTLVNKNLGSKQIGAIGNSSILFPYSPSVQLVRDERAGSEGSAVLDRVLRYINNRRYLFTRLLLSLSEPDQISDLVERLVFLDGANNQIPLRNFIEPVPVGFTSGSVIFKMRKMASNFRSLADPDVLDFMVKQARGMRLKNLPNLRNKTVPTLHPMLTFQDEIHAWFSKMRPSLSLSDEVFLPTSGLFAEAVLGRSNASEKIDLTRFFNWQDSPIPNAAPLISAVSTDRQLQTPPELNATVTDGVLNVLPPTTLPDPTGLSGVLAAVQNGNIFRNMSQAAVLGSILNNLAGVAERTATAAGQLSGNALSDTLQAATRLAENVASGVQNLAGSGLKTLTQLGGEANLPIPAEITPPKGETPPPPPPPPTPVPPTPIPPKPPTQEEPQPQTPQPKLQQVEVKMRIFVPKPAELVIPVNLTGGSGLMAFLGDNRGFSYEGGSSRLDMSMTFQVNTETLEIVDSPQVSRIPGTAAIFDVGDFEPVPAADGETVPPWAGRPKPGATPVRAAVVDIPEAKANISLLKLRQDEVTVNLKVSANLVSPPIPLPSFPGSEAVESVFNLIATSNIDANIFIAFTREAGGRLRFLISGRHDGFPAYEIYVNKLGAYFWDPILEGTDNRDMQDFKGQAIEMNAPLLVPQNK